MYRVSRGYNYTSSSGLLFFSSTNFLADFENSGFSARVLAGIFSRKKTGAMR